MTFGSLRAPIRGTALAVALAATFSLARAQDTTAKNHAAVLGGTTAVVGSQIIPDDPLTEVLVGVRSTDDTVETRGRIEKLGGAIKSKQAKLMFYRVKVKSGLTVAQAMAQLKADPSVAYVEPNVVLRAFGTPNDTYFNSNQYAPQKVQANLAWDLWKPKSQVVLAVIDTGVQLNHPDLVNKLVAGYDFVNSDSSPNDDNGHGTHCAGIAAAETNNGVGIAGIAGWNGDALNTDTTSTKVMPIKVLGADGSGSTSTVAEGVLYAADHGASVITLSLGGGSTTTLSNAISYAINKGCVVVAAAGNSSSSAVSYPAAYTNVLSVASTDANDTLSSFSNYGSWVKVAAPGQNIASTYTGSSYAYLSGTSMAAPLVAGEAALIRSHNPALSNIQIQQLIINNTDAYTPYSGRTIAGGRVNVYRALLAASGTSSTPQVPSAPTGLAGQALSRSQIYLTWADNADNETGVIIERSSNGVNFQEIATVGANVRAFTNTGLNTNSVYYYRIRAYNAAGKSAYSNTIAVRTTVR